MSYRGYYSIVTLILVCFVFVDQTYAEYRFSGITHNQPTSITVDEQTTLEFVSSSVQDNMVQDAYLYYRSAGNISYEQIPVQTEGNRFTAQLTVNDSGTESVDYYLQIELLDGSIVHYPSQNPESSPITVNVISSEQKQDSDIAGNVGFIQYNILSPEPGEIVAEDDVVIAFTMFYGEDDAIPENFRVKYNGRDVTQSADVSPFFISYLPSSIRVGEQRIEIILDDEEEGEIEIASWRFEIVSEDEMEDIERRSRHIPNARVELSARNQSIGGFDSEVYRASSRISGTAGDNIRYSINGLLTSQEDPRLQPQNRYGAELYVGNWFEIQAGHIYPQLSPLMMAGRRIHGVNSTLRLFWQRLEFQAVYGTINRSVDMLYSDVQRREVVLGHSSQGVPITEDVFELGMQTGGMGTYQRDVMGGRVAFGSAQRFQFGINALKVEDNLSSLAVVRDADTALEQGYLTTSRYNTIQEDDELSFRVAGGTPRAEGNFLVGADMAVNAHNNRIQFRADFAGSMHNTDISEGILNQERADDFGIDLDSDIENYLDMLSTLIIINERLSVLPFRVEDGELAPFVPSSIFAGQGRLGLNYFNNNLNIQYRWVGPDYTSLANSSIRKDIQGFTVTDRFRMMNNTVFVTLGYENLHDNLSGHRPATTNTVNYRGNVSWYPVQRYLPRVTFSLRHQTRDNEVERYNDLNAVRNVRIMDGDEILEPNPRNTDTWQYSINLSQSFTYFGLDHDVNLGFSDITTTDNVFAYGDFYSRTFSAGFGTRFNAIPLRTELNTSYSSSVALNGLNEVDIFGISTSFSYFLLDERLNLRSDFAVTFNEMYSYALVPTSQPDSEFQFDDVFIPADEADIEDTNSYIFRLGARYNITNNHSFIFDANFTNVSLVRTSDQQTVNIPNDRILQVRYVFSF